MTFQEFLGRLLTERDLRRRYREAPEAVLAAADMDDGDRNAARALEIDAVERQARALVHKRYTEVRQMLPATFDALGHSALQLCGLCRHLLARRSPPASRRCDRLYRLSPATPAIDRCSGSKTTVLQILRTATAIWLATNDHAVR